MLHTLHVPTIKNTDEHNAHSATFEIEPLHTGYGVTLGNALRRVMLSSLGGAAVLAFRIEGTNHEFSTLDGVKEDVVQIMLNMKRLRFKVYADGLQTVTITKKGAGVVTAADIETTADVEVVNPEHLIATLDNAKADFKAEIIVQKGRGYVPAEEHEHDFAEGFIAIDAIFTPIERVRYKVDDTRVGQITDLDKLVITIDTDDSISPRQALEESAAILVNQFRALTSEEQTAQFEVAVETVEESEEVSELNTRIEEMNLSARTTNALLNNEITTIKDLVTLTDGELKELKGFGSKALDEVQDIIKSLEL